MEEGTKPGALVNRKHLENGISNLKKRLGFLHDRVSARRVYLVSHFFFFLFSVMVYLFGCACDHIMFVCAYCVVALQVGQHMT